MGGLIIPARRGFLLKTGQTTVYVAGDNGTNPVGLAKAYQVLTTGQYAGNTNITINSKTDAHPNACVLDLNTGLMWSRKESASVGPASDGKIPWTTTGSGATAEGIWPYVAAANAAQLAGYSDWRIPNMFELVSLMDLEVANGLPDGTVFPGWNANWTPWTATTTPNDVTKVMTPWFLNGGVLTALKTATNFCILVRGGNF